MEDVRFNVDAMARLAHGVQLCLVKVFAVLDDRDLVVTRDFGTHQRFQLIQECLRVNRDCGRRSKRVL